jgi:hypothetical protein
MAPTGADENGAITLSLVTTQVKAAPATLSGGGRATYDTGTVTANVNGMYASEQPILRVVCWLAGVSEFRGQTGEAHFVGTDAY